MGSNNPTRSLFDMPPLGVRGAPSKFKGDFDDVERFLDRVDRLLKHNNVADDKEQVQCLLDYCSKDVREVIKGLTDFQTPNWKELQKAVKKIYNSDQSLYKFKEKDLKNLTKRSQKKMISSIKRFREYQRAFIRIAGFLLARNKITVAQKAKYFWKGLHSTLRTRIEHRLVSMNPKLDPTAPFDESKIVEAVEYLMRQDRFDDTDDESDKSRSRSDSDASDSDSDDTDDSDAEDSEEEEKKKKKKKKKKMRQAKHKAKE
ncbi:hypothetical protein BD410DRAFT_719236, partial [Rickenella mellea]